MKKWFNSLVRNGVDASMTPEERDEVKVLNSMCIHFIINDLILAVPFLLLLSDLRVEIGALLTLFVGMQIGVIWLNGRKKFFTAYMTYGAGMVLGTVFICAFIGLESNFQFLLVPTFFVIGVSNKTNGKDKLLLIFILLLMATAALVFLQFTGAVYHPLIDEEISLVNYILYVVVIAKTFIILMVNYRNIASRNIVKELQLGKVSAQASIFRAMSDNIISGLYRSTPNEGMEYANRSFLRLFGYDDQRDVHSLDPTSMYADPTDRARILHKLKRNGVIDQERLRFKRKDDSEFWGSLTVTITQELGQTYFDGLIIDITESLLKEEEILARDKNLVEAQQLAKLGNWSIDYRSNELQWSDEMYSIYDRPSKLGVPELEDFAKIFSNEDGVTHQKLSKGVPDGPNVSERWITTEGGVRKFIRSIFYFELEGKTPVQCRGTLQDITEQKVMREKVIATHDFYERVLDESPIEAAILDADFRYVFLNKQSVKNKEVREWLIGKTDHDYCEFRGLDNSFAEERDAQHKRALETEGAALWEEKMTDREGQTNYILRSTLCLRDDEGKVMNYLGYGFNVTRMREAQIVLEHRNEELQKLNSELDSFVYSVSHDLRAPIASVLGLINLGVEADSKDEIQTIFQMQREALERLDAYIREVIDFSRNQRLGVSPERIRLAEMIDEVLEGVRFIPEISQISINTSMPQDLIIYTDSLRLKVVLNNLIANAIRYSDFKKPHQFVNITATSIGEGVKIEVSDNGIGIRKEFMKKVWKMFFRGTSQSSGSGLGLYILKEAMDKLGGTVSLESEHEIGSTFTIEIPKCEEPSTPDARSGDSSQSLD